MNWLKAFREEFTTVTKLHNEIGFAQDLGRIEAALDRFRPDRVITKDLVEEIVRSEEWAYHKWWDDTIGDRIKKPIEMPQQLWSPTEKESAIRLLYAPIKQIEVVSVILRFWCPKEFGIISPPVTSILALSPRKDHVEYYGNYLRILRDLAAQYDFDQLADVDMALWSAAHLHLSKASKHLTKEMNRDSFFQEIRLKNLAQGLGANWQGLPREQWFLSLGLLERDYLTSALLASRPFESLVIQIAKLSKINRWTRERWSPESKTRLAYYVRELEKSNENPSVRWFGPGRLYKLLDIRNRAVHPDEPEPPRKPPSKEEAKDFVNEGIPWLKSWRDRLRQDP